MIATDLVDYHSPGQDHGDRNFLLERVAPDGVEMIVTKLSHHGAEQTETLRAFTRYEAEAIIRKL